MKPPHGLEEIKRVYGDPRALVGPDGRVAPAWENAILTLITLPAPLTLSFDSTPEDPAPVVTRMRCHRLVAPELGAALAEVHAAGLWEGLNTFGGCYEWRRQRRSSKLSTHSWGIAIDVDVDRNPLGATPMIDERIVAIFERRGWTWGGRFGQLDAMHFQFASGY